MQIDFVETQGPVSSIAALVRAIVSVFHSLLTPFPAATCLDLSFLMPPRRRTGALSPQNRGGARLRRAAVPSGPVRSFLQRYRLPSRGPTHQRVLHHQARDTLMGEEGLEMIPFSIGCAFPFGSVGR